ncbi:MAG: ROK family protein [Actinobacteria bacterium]|nr:ROK family protein [Actinomycetota bacterium]MSV70872.1 ROK family protein [Actinomycetota bacterium]MSW13503.1 ROK family protein [Actinomycetota bacterium]MSX46814.1 ROK family protein [Actinomycetota bacterium]MSX91096.1 ROK family protein [Actinomycetota bacterium]
MGIDVGGTKVLGGVVTGTGEILATARRDTPREGGRALTEAIANVATELIQQYSVDSIGVSAAGFISSERQTMLATPNISNWNGVNLVTELTEILHKKIVLENDANAAAWGEFKFGAGRGRSDLMMLTLGTGVGGGLILGSSVFRGAFGIGAELGHIRIVPEGQLCGCGIRGCLEQYASGSALLRHAREAIDASPLLARNLLERGDGTIEGLRGNHITEAARDGDPVAIAAFNTMATYLGAGIASLCAVIDPSCVVLGGGVIDAGELFLGPTRDAALRLIPFSGKHPYPEIVAAVLGNHAGLVGVADLSRI